MSTKTSGPGNKNLRRIVGCILPAALLIFMQWYAANPDAPGYVIAPSHILASATQLLFSGDLIQDLGASAIRSYSGFLIGSVTGIFIGLLSAVWRPGEAFFDPLVSTLYPVPKIALLPIIITWLGFGDSSKIVVIAVAVFFPTFINTLYGAKATPARLIWAAQNMGATRRKIFTHVVFPSTLPAIFTGLRTGLALSFIVLFAAEMVGSRRGLGDLIMRAEDAMRYDWMYVAILAIGIMGFISDRILLLIRRQLLSGKAPGENYHA